MIEASLVSVLMTSYNREKYIGAAIESVLASTYKNFELIIVDDCSKDKTVEIARSYEVKDARVKVYVNEMNLGDYPNRNRAASYAKGKYLKYVDADDLIYPWGLDILVTTMEESPDAGWGLCSLEQDVFRPFPFVLLPSQAYTYNYFGPGLFHKAPLSAIIKRDVFEAVGCFKDIRMAGDYEMWHRLGLRFNVALMPHGIVWSRVHGEQEMNSFLKYTNVYDNIRMEYLKRSDCPLEEKDVNSLLVKYRRIAFRQIFKLLLKLELREAKERFINWSKF